MQRRMLGALWIWSVFLVVLSAPISAQSASTNQSRPTPLGELVDVGEVIAALPLLGKLMEEALKRFRMGKVFAMAVAGDAHLSDKATTRPSERES